MKNKKISWEKTRNLYVNWLSKTSLRNYFSKDILFENLSLWWLTNLLEKDRFMPKIPCLTPNLGMWEKK